MVLQYYEFQCRVLTLCAEFCGAAEELVVRSPNFMQSFLSCLFSTREQKETPPSVVAQCYQLGPGYVDQLSMLGDAKRNCHFLVSLQNLNHA
jgi:hypothetical protein